MKRRTRTADRLGAARWGGALLCSLGVALTLTLTTPAPARAQDGVELSAEAQDAFFRGVGLLEGGDPGGALVAFDEAASYQPELRRVYYYRARALAALGRPDDAAASLDAYERFGLPEAERAQAQELRGSLGRDAPAEPEPAALPPSEDPAEVPRSGDPAQPPPSGDPAQPPPSADPVAEADRRLAEASAALAEERCDDALAASQRALRLAPGRSRAFLLKGLALRCKGELGRARTVLSTYLELEPEPDPAAEEALDAIAGLLHPRPRPPPEPRGDPRIQGVLDRRFGTPDPGQGATVLVPGVGAARHRGLHRELAGARAEGEQLALWTAQGLQWARLRIDSGGDSGWFGRAFEELLSLVAQGSGDPDHVHRDGSVSLALAGRVRYEALWRDEDGDRLRLRLGRCARRDADAAYLPESAPCVELTGAAGTWSPAPRATDTPEARAAALVRTPGARAFDFSVGLGGGGGFGLLVDRGTGAPSLAPEVGADLLVRFAVGAFVAGFLWAPSAAGFAGDTTLGPFFESRLQGYVGVRANHLQSASTDLLFGLGVLPQVDAFGLPSGAATLSFRVVKNVRRSRMGAAWVSFEPWVMLSSGEVRLVPLRFTVGGAVGTRPRLAGGRPLDGPWGVKVGDAP